MSRKFSIGVFAFTGLYFALFFFYPLVHAFAGAFNAPDGGFTFDFLRETFANPIHTEGLANAFMLGLVSTILSFLLALPLAILADRFTFPGKAVMAIVILIPLILPPFIGAIGIKHILGANGSLNALLDSVGILADGQRIDWLGRGRFWGVAIMNALHLYPILFLNLTSSLASLDPAMEEAAENLGASRWTRLRKIVLPLTMPGVFAGGTIVFIWSFTELGVPLIFDYSKVTSVQIFNGLLDIDQNPVPFTLFAALLICTASLFLLSKFFFGNSNLTMFTPVGTRRQKRSLSPFKGWLATLFFASIAAIAIIPHLAVLLMSVTGEWYGTILPESLTGTHFKEALVDPLVVPSIQNSLFYSFFATLIDLVLGVSIAWVVVRSRLPGRHILDTLAMLPLAVPGLVLAFGYFSMTRDGQFFSFLRYEGNPLLILVIAYATRRLPYIVRTAAAGFQQTPLALEEAARSLGCPPLRSMAKITLPLIAANLTAGALIAFSFAMLEVSDSLVLAQHAEHYPITKAIYQLVNSLANGHFLASALGVWAMVFLAVTMTGAALMLGRKLALMFRL